MSVRTCGYQDCDKPLRDNNRRGFCEPHAWKAQLDAKRGIKKAARPECQAVDCQNRIGPQNQCGFCKSHQAERGREIRAKASVDRRVCAVEGCPKKLKVDNLAGYCQRHKIRLHREPVTLCRFDGCKNILQPNNVVGVCVRHYQSDKTKKRLTEKTQWIEHVDRFLVLERDAEICHICGWMVDPSDWHMDHVIPLSKGGLHCYANVAVSHPRCNLSKGARLP